MAVNESWYLTYSVLNWVVYGVLAWFAYLDYAALGRLGYPKRFHWAWSFLSSIVYVLSLIHI